MANGAGQGPYSRERHVARTTLRRPIRRASVEMPHPARPAAALREHEGLLPCGSFPKEPEGDHPACWIEGSPATAADGDKESRPAARWRIQAPRHGQIPSPPYPGEVHQQGRLKTKTGNR